MESNHTAFDDIDASTFNEVLEQYPTVVPEKLADLEEQRLNIIPNALKERDPPFLTMAELTVLMDWKL